jgi:membrane associated rhomboid family serine protease
MIPLRDDTPARALPLANYLLIGACAVTYLWQLSLSARGQQAVILGLGFIPATLLGGAVLPPELVRVPPAATLLTSMFLHGGWGHLAGNMLYLYIFGKQVEGAMGHRRYALFYLLCGALAALAEAVTNMDSRSPMIGASGAISGVLGAYLVLRPRGRILMLNPFAWPSRLVHVPAALVLGVWFLLQVVASLRAGGGQEGIAWVAHVAGFVMGMMLIPAFKSGDVPLFR